MNSEAKEWAATRSFRLPRCRRFVSFPFIDPPTQGCRSPFIVTVTSSTAKPCRSRFPSCIVPGRVISEVVEGELKTTVSWNKKMYKHDIVLFIFPLIIIFTVRIGGELLASVFAWQSRNVYLEVELDTNPQQCKKKRRHTHSYATHSNKVWGGDLLPKYRPGIPVRRIMSRERRSNPWRNEEITSECAGVVVQGCCLCGGRDTVFHMRASLLPLCLLVLCIGTLLVFI